MCVTSFSEPSSDYKQTTKILKLRDYNCGAWDSDPPLDELVEIKYITKYLIHYKKVELKNKETYIE